jgi:hypothetical protein
MKKNITSLYKNEKSKGGATKKEQKEGREKASPKKKFLLT